MKSVDTTGCLAHVLVCTNRRPDSDLPCCGNADADEIYDIFADWLDDRALRTRIWLTRTECLGWCHVDGTTVVFYPEDAWYRAVRPRDCAELIARHLQPLTDTD